ncbi:hypothetical protein [Labrys monachus]|uniref:Chemotaxis protein histidine kinase CheA n=1 Tax=Labrys monachus TaxID=217067 RepID=A0ABU0FLC2_9HYPH|nr:hypothetical protein [Labrys monachus]MDQ0395162.1 chemotaxis protein histidine kinase CheA [Labrys monachus]
MQPVPPQPLLSEEDYGAIEAAVMETARGRWFLAEYARRNRNADTAAVLAAIHRLERLVESAASTDARSEVAKGMANIARAIAEAEIPLSADTAGAAIRRMSASASQAIRIEADIEPREPGPAEEPVAGQPAETVAAGLPEPAPAAQSDTEIGAEPPAIAAQAQAEPVADEPVAEAQQDAVAEAGAEPVAATQPEAVAAAQPDPDVASGPSEEPPAESEPPVRGAPAPVEAGADAEGAAPATSSASEPFPILELDEEAADALLARDAQRPELKLPVNHLAASRRSRLDMATLLAVPREAPPKQVRSGLVTFVDEEPAENAESVFSAPLRLEPEEPPAKEAEPQALVRSSSWSRLPTAPRMTVAEIEAMPFKKRAALFS